MKSLRFAVLAVVVALCGCTSSAELRDKALNEAEAHCKSERKQFILKKTEQKEDFWTGSQAIITGVCVGPGDPRIVVPSAKPVV